MTLNTEQEHHCFMRGAAERVLQYYVNESRYDMEFGTAALIPREKLPDFLENVDDRLLALREDMVCSSPAEFDDIETHMRELSDCRAQIVRRMLDYDDIEVLDSAEDIIENIVVASLIHYEVLRAREALSNNDPRIIAELAYRRASNSRESQIALHTTLCSTVGMFRLGEEFEPNPRVVHQRVVGLLEEIHDRVCLAYETDE